SSASAFYTLSLHDALPIFTYTSEDGGPRLMRSVLKVRNEHGRAIHPTQKPLELLRPMVRYSCPPGGLVLAPFSGSAAVEVAAVRSEEHTSELQSRGHLVCR